MFTKDNIPSIIGKLVYTCFESFIYNKAEGEIDLNLFKLAIYKIGILKQKHINHDRNLNQREQVLKEKTPLLIQSHCKKSNYAVTGFGLASTLYFLSRDQNTTAYRSALVTGSRTLAARYKEFSFQNVLDIDIQSCYASVLNNLIFPIGRPTYYFLESNDKRITLKEFLDLNEHEFIPGLWQITINDLLDFNQDLIFSKIMTEDYVNSRSLINNTVKDEIDHIQSEHALLRREIYDGVLTDRLLEIVRKVSSQKELKDFYNLKVQAAIYWKISNRLTSLKEWTEHVLEESTSSQTQAWFGTNISEFTKVISEKRVVEKQIAKKFLTT